MHCSGFNNTAVPYLKLRSPITKSANRDRYLWINFQTAQFFRISYIAKKIGALHNGGMNRRDVQFLTYMTKSSRKYATPKK